MKFKCANCGKLIDNYIFERCDYSYRRGKKNYCSYTCYRTVVCKPINFKYYVGGLDYKIDKIAEYFLKSLGVKINSALVLLSLYLKYKEGIKKVDARGLEDFYLIKLGELYSPVDKDAHLDNSIKLHFFKNLRHHLLVHKYFGLGNTVSEFFITLGKKYNQYLNVRRIK